MNKTINDDEQIKEVKEIVDAIYREGRHDMANEQPFDQYIIDEAVAKLSTLLLTSQIDTLTEFEKEWGGGRTTNDIYRVLCDRIKQLEHQLTLKKEQTK